MSTATTFRAAIGAAVVFLVIAIAAIVNHFIQPANAHPFFGLKLGLVLLLVALACGVYANYNRPTNQI